MNSTTNLDEPKRIEIANKVFDTLVGMGVTKEHPDSRFSFVHIFAEMLLAGNGEYRQSMGLGFGGKVWVNDHGTRIYVNQYREDETKESQKTVKAINEKLAALLVEFIGE